MSGKWWRGSLVPGVEVEPGFRGAVQHTAKAGVSKILIKILKRHLAFGCRESNPELQHYPLERLRPGRGSAVVFEAAVAEKLGSKNVVLDLLPLCESEIRHTAKAGVSNISAPQGNKNTDLPYSGAGSRTRTCSWWRGVTGTEVKPAGPG
ncbi:hypothetical protein B0H14DRAFT_2637293 [Mycena olivaceomarginata]|nr:hypothetical protein B0H14DRAFT_2637293 [Mycena olivaceomarginata]